MDLGRGLGLDSKFPPDDQQRAEYDRHGAEGASLAAPGAAGEEGVCEELLQHGVETLLVNPVSP